jgi:2-succinyl-5-enolpyruvyl-6-hydroxy-3-cyclohexene-1-carboxylate synthase
LNEAIQHTRFPESGPVHVNIPFDEPLYQTVSKGAEAEMIDFDGDEQSDLESLKARFLADWQKSQRVMILVGQGVKDPLLNEVLIQLSENKNAVVLTETTSNLNSTAFVDCIDNVLSTFDDDENFDFQPDMLITLGNAIVSKKIKKYLRNYRPKSHWHLSRPGEKRDTYFALTQSPAVDPVSFLGELNSILPAKEEKFSYLWMRRKQKVTQLREQYLTELGWSDLKVFEVLLKRIPEDSILHLGNSTPVRYSQLFGSLPRFQYFSNRGVSGIDGQLSTAAGSAYANGKINSIITGDLGFFYDSNALMNQNLSFNLKIIVINNGGGGIFRFIPGPDSSNQLEKFFEARHSWKAEFLAKAFDVNYFQAHDENDLRKVLPLFYAEDARPALLEIFTPSEVNATILRDYFSFLKTASH